MVLRKKDLNCTHWRKKFVKRSMIYHTRIHPSRKWSKCLSTLPEFHKGQSISTYFCCSSLPFTKKTPQLISSLGTKKGGGGGSKHQVRAKRSFGPLVSVLSGARRVAGLEAGYTTGICVAGSPQVERNTSFLQPPRNWAVRPPPKGLKTKTPERSYTI